MQVVIIIVSSSHYVDVAVIMEELLIVAATMEVVQVWVAVCFLASSVLSLYADFAELFLVMFSIVVLVKHLHSSISFLVVLVLLMWVTAGLI